MLSGVAAWSKLTLTRNFSFTLTKEGAPDEKNQLAHTAKLLKLETPTLVNKVRTAMPMDLGSHNSSRTLSVATEN